VPGAFDGTASTYAVTVATSAVNVTIVAELPSPRCDSQGSITCSRGPLPHSGDTELTPANGHQWTLRASSDRRLQPHSHRAASHTMLREAARCALLRSPSWSPTVLPMSAHRLTHRGVALAATHLEAKGGGPTQP
jgi:hypothetical protein